MKRNFLIFPEDISTCRYTLFKSSIHVIINENSNLEIPISAIHFKNSNVWKYSHYNRINKCWMQLEFGDILFFMNNSLSTAPIMRKLRSFSTLSFRKDEPQTKVTFSSSYDQTFNRKVNFYS